MEKFWDIVQKKERYFKLPWKKYGFLWKKGLSRYRLKNTCTTKSCFSRVESTRVKLKKYLQVFTSNLCQVKENICHAIDNNFQEIKTHLSSERLRIPHICNVSFFKELVHHVSSFVFRESIKQYEMVKFETMNPLCSDQFIVTIGFPCAHKMLELKEESIPLALIHS